MSFQGVRRVFQITKENPSQGRVVDRSSTETSVKTQRGRDRLVKQGTHRLRGRPPEVSPSRPWSNETFSNSYTKS